jgi:hypothetical protein
MRKEEGAIVEQAPRFGGGGGETSLIHKAVEMMMMMIGTESPVKLTIQSRLPLNFSFI